MAKFRLQNKFMATVMGGVIASSLFAFSQDMAAHAAGSENCGRTVFYGDSLAQGLFDHAASAGWNAEDAAIPGVGIWNGYKSQRAAMENDYLNKIRLDTTVLVSLGTNDLAHFKGNKAKEQRYFDEFRERIRQIKEDRGGYPIILGVSSGAYKGFSQSTRNYANGRVNNMLKSIAEEFGVPYIDTTKLTLKRTDGLHYSRSANKALLAQLDKKCF